MAAGYATIPNTVLSKPEPFHVNISEEQLNDFKTLLKLSRVSAPTYESLQEDGKYGVIHKWITESKKYWEDEFDWRKCEDHMNSFPHFSSKVKVADVELKIHFVALFSEKTDAIPVALFHGWPGSFLEFLPILSLMKEKYTPQTLPYHLIVPSLPGYAFSDTPPLDREFDVRDISNFMNQLMIDLGFESGYIAQGGDIGSRVSRTLGIEHAACKAVHVNYAPIPSAPEGLSVSSLSERDKAGYERGQEFVKTSAAYAYEQATRPSTVGIALGSSPLAVLAWVGEKLMCWPDDPLPLELILEEVTLYWFTESMARGIYPYRGRMLPGPQPGSQYLDKPFGYSNFAKELMPTPKSWAATTGNLVFYKEYDKGGHFAALERPAVLMEDIEEFVKQVWKI